VRDRNWKAPRTSWGEPRFEVVWSTDDMRVDPEYVATVKDPATYSVPFTFRLMITTRPNYETYEYSCNAGE
jgi:hypothetical protein